MSIEASSWLCPESSSPCQMTEKRIRRGEGADGLVPSLNDDSRFVPSSHTHSRASHGSEETEDKMGRPYGPCMFCLLKVPPTLHPARPLPPPVPPGPRPLYFCFFTQTSASAWEPPPPFLPSWPVTASLSCRAPLSHGFIRHHGLTSRPDQSSPQTRLAP